jgi:hypothetical protein
VRRKPKNYVGTKHETIGSDIRAVLGAVPRPRTTLGEEMTARIEKLDPNGWYPIEMLLEVMDVLSERMGQFALLEMGRKLFKQSHEQRVKQTARSAADIIYGLDGMYHHANRGDKIGGWKVLRFVPGEAVLEKTTPHNCVMEEGLFAEAMIAVNVPATVRQSQCLLKGAGACKFVITSSIADERWSGGRPPQR